MRMGRYGSGWWEGTCEGLEGGQGRRGDVILFESKVY